jgi:pyruvate,water dikinase
MIVRIPGDPAPLALVGGKAASLARMAEAGLPVPPAQVLSTAFFAPWYAALQATDAWAALAADPTDPARADAVKARVPDLVLSPEQAEVLARLTPTGTVAVRSSSPEEDLEGASFAGGYATRLGVTAATLEEAVRHCFASSLDVRVLVYKASHGFDPLRPAIAVVIQEQVDSVIAGVAFSLDPIHNDYDVAVIDSAWGLGESVVSGAVSPDHYAVDKVTGAVLSRRVGSKERCVRLGPDGGVVQVDPKEQETLDDARLAELTALVSQVEDLYGLPVDVEWAIADDTLVLLQARPITAWIPLPPALTTEPGERRRLYMDMGLAGGLTMNAPMTPIGQSWFAHFGSTLVRTFLGELPASMTRDDLVIFAGGRMYQDLSNVLWLVSPELLGRSQKANDALAGDTLLNVDRARYRAQRRPSWFGPGLLWRYPRAVWRARGMLSTAARALLWPEACREAVGEARRAFHARMRALQPERGLDALIDAEAESVVRHVIATTMPPLLVALGLGGLVAWLVPRRLADAVDDLQRGVPGNVVVELGVALHELSGFVEPGTSAEELQSLLASGTAPPGLAAAWERFLERFGHRGPSEVDMGAPRYGDDGLLALRPVASMAGNGFSPAEARERRVQANGEAFERLMGELGPVRRAIVRFAQRRMWAFLGTRDDPKHDYLLFFHVLRRAAVERGRQLVAAGRLDAPEQAVDLTLPQLRDETLDLRAARRDNRRFLETLETHVRAFPIVIDSRGRVVRPAQREEGPGELVGTPVSPGVVRGRVVLLRRPDEKPVQPGDVLVAHTTDPGWTPLFVNAAAVVLSVGGVLQHGAVVAREYGKPCVAGIPSLLDRLEDGQWVEVDGSAGVVRVVEGPVETE